jgi:hypothetical protein
MEKRTQKEKSAAKTAALQNAKHKAKKLRTEEKKIAEIILDVETTNPKEETTMESTITAPSRSQLVTVISEMNHILADCKIPTDKKYTNEILTNMILAKELELTSTDFLQPDQITTEGENLFSADAAAIMVHLGITIPAPPKPKSDKKTTTKKTAGYTRQQALVDAIKSGPGTREEIVAKADVLYRAANPIEISEDEKERARQSACDTFTTTKLLRESTPILLAFRSILFDETTKIYSLPAIESIKA